MVAWLKVARIAALTFGVAAAPALAQSALAQSALAQDVAIETSGAPAVATPEQVQAARANPPRFADAWVAYQEGDTAYFECVETKKKAALAEMWRRGAPLEAAIYEVSLAYRQCPGFEPIWAAMYFAGFDSPEHWIALEFQAAKTAVLAKQETDVAALDRAARLFANAAQETSRVNRGSRRARVAARDALLRHRYVVAALRPDQALAPDIQELVQEYGELLTAILPEQAGESLKQALELAKKRDAADDLAALVVNGKR